MGKRILLAEAGVVGRWFEGGRIEGEEVDGVVCWKVDREVPGYSEARVKMSVFLRV